MRTTFISLLRTAILAVGGTCAMAMAQVPLCVDPSFQAPFMEIGISDIDFMPDGRILVCGHMRNPIPAQQPSSFAVNRLWLDGAIDPAFHQLAGSSGIVRIWNDDYFFSAGGIGIRRHFLDGTVDPSFQGADSPAFWISSGGDLHVFPDDRLWRAGLFSKQLYDEEGQYIGSEQGYGLLQLQPDGVPDPDFDHKYVAPGWLTSIRETPDGRFLFGSASGTQYEGRPVGRILRVWPDGHLDTTFHSTIYWGQVSRNYYFYPDGRILAFGQFQTPEYPGDTLAVVRLHPDGSTDTTWPVIPFRNPQYFFPGLAYVIDFLEIEPGRLIIVGDFDTVDGQPAGGIAAIDTAGNVLWDYFTGSDAGELQLSIGGTNRYLRGIKEAPDGYIYIYGSYHGFDDGYANHPDQRMITRLYPLHVGMEERTPDRAVQVYPNPASDRLTIQVADENGQGIKQVRLLDATGREALLSTMRGPLLQLDVSGLQGLFLVLVEGNGERYTERIIIH
ncbi:MAG: T9SS type A sorting domain-containing protein [Flavobacteriales bacterium]|jgi:uncharacterized delta-60 repeat protein|nr:T9SS type A sorting domain-containing protein [Flavobacteriales bacterium]